LTRILLALLLFVLSLPALAQDSAEEERSYFVGFVENQLSTPNRQIRISGIQGVLSSNATIGQITIADRDGIWLRITNARIVWTRSALLLGRLDIDTLAADSIEVLRKPLPEEGLPPPEAGTFQIPELPLSVTLGNLNVPRVTFGQDVFGLASEISVDGRLRLADGSLDTAVNVTRLDGPGGQLALTATYANATQLLNLDLSFSEPADGIVANLLAIEGRPPVVLTLKGSGPLSELALGLTLDAASERVLTGTTQVRKQADGYAFTTNLEGPIAKIIPAQFRAFFGAETTLTAGGLFKDAGGFRLDSLDLDSAALNIAAAAETAADGFLQRFNLDATIADAANNTKVVLPVPGGETTVDRAAFKLLFGEAATEEWNGSIDIDGLATGTFSSEKIAITLSGLAQNLAQPSSRRITFNADGAATGIVADRADVQQALGDRITLDIEGAWDAGQPVKLAKALLAGNGLSVSLAGDIAELVFRGNIAIDAASIAPLSELAGRELAGAVDFDATGEVKPVGGGFDLTLDGTATGLQVDSPAADHVLEGETRVTGRVARGETGLVADKLRVFNSQVELTADGTFATGAADFDFDLALTDLALLSERRASGRLTARGRAAGADGLIGLTFGADIANGTLVGRTLDDAAIAFEGTLQDNDLNGQLMGSAFLDRVKVSLASAVAVSENERRLGDLDFTAGATRITGGVTQGREGLLDGVLKLDSSDISTAAALLLLDAKGSAEADITLSADGARQMAEVKATVSRIEVDTVRLGKADLQATIADLFKVPTINGMVAANTLSAGGIDVATLQATAAQSGDTTGFAANAALENGTTASVKGALSPVDGGYRVGLESLDLAQGQLAARLVEPSAITIRGQNVALDSLVMDVGGGRVTAAGRIEDTLALDVAISALPLAIANTVKPDLHLGGTLDGVARIVGTRARPDINFDIRGRELTAAALSRAGLASITIDAKGTSTTTRLNVNASVTSPEGLRATVAGGVPLDDGDLALDVALNAFPLAVLNAATPGQNLGGNLSGSAKVTGKLADPAASFQLRGTGVRAAPLETAGAAPLDVTAAGRYGGKVLILSSATVNGPQGLAISANGRIPISGGGVGITISGSVPLGLANRFLAERGAQVSGTLRLDANVSGSLQNPAIRGTFSTAGAEFIDPESNVRLRDIAVTASIDGQTVTIRNVSAALASGGRIGATGTISTNAATGFPANIRITLDQARYTDGNMVVATLNGNLTVSGPLARDPLISGTIDVDRAEIMVPDSLGGGAAAIDVKHIRPPRDVAATLRRAKANDGTPTPTARPSVVRLDVTVNAPRRIFVRGRGLDAELGGSVRLTGPVTNIQPVGGFQMIRGRLSILAQRITFDEGEVSLVGDLDPFLNFVARSPSDDITVFITVSGRVSDLKIAFSSQPELPEDEVLARLIFNRGINELSPIQIAQLAAAAAELAGGSNTSLLGNLRNATGLDDIDIVTDTEGNAAVRAGRYISDNVYLGVEAGAQGSTKGTINLDITEELKARGAVGTNDSSVGIFYEKDY
jgi:translocation and assembly module TamB